MNADRQAQLQAWLREQGHIGTTPLEVKPLTGGQSNPTYLLTSGEQQLVLRKQPDGPLLNLRMRLIVSIALLPRYTTVQSQFRMR